MLCCLWRKLQFYMYIYYFKQKLHLNFAKRESIAERQTRVCILLFKKDLFMRESAREKEIFLCTESLPKCLQHAGLEQAEARMQERQSDVSPGCQGL